MELDRYIIFTIGPGKKHKAETIEKMKKSQNGKQEGEKNSQFGTYWIRHQELGNKKIKKEELDHYLEAGWVRGRKYEIK